MSNKDDTWIKKQLLQDALDDVLRTYEKKGIMVKTIQLVMLPPHPSKKSKPFTRVNLFE